MAENNQKQPGHRRGRPTDYTAELGTAICNELASGKSLRRICRSKSMPPESTVRGWVVDNVGGFSAQYTRARDAGLDLMADEVLDVCDRKGRDVQRDRLRFDARRWYLSKLAPKRYGDRLEHVGTLQHENRLDQETVDAILRAARRDRTPILDIPVRAKGKKP